MLTFKKGQTYICTKSDKRWWTVGKEYPVFLDSYNEPAIRDDDGDDWHPNYFKPYGCQFKLKEDTTKGNTRRAEEASYSTTRGRLA